MSVPISGDYRKNSGELIDNDKVLLIPSVVFWQQHAT